MDFAQVLPRGRRLAARHQSRGQLVAGAVPRAILVGSVVSRALAESGLPAASARTRNTKSVLLHNNEENISTLVALKKKPRGINRTFDDFGTGYSSLSYLRVFPLRQDQDRSVLYQRAFHAVGLCGDRLRDHQPGADPQHCDHGGRRGDTRSISAFACCRLFARAGLLAKPANAASGASRHGRVPSRCGSVVEGWAGNSSECADWNLGKPQCGDRDGHE